MNNSSPQKIRQAALRLLARREHSAQELKQKLKSRTFAGEQVELVLEELREAGYLSDQRAAEMIFRRCIEKRLGLKRIQLEMQQKGIDQSLVEQVLKVNQDVDWLQLARAALAKKFNPEPSDLVLIAKKQRYLIQRGFDFEIIQQALTTHSES
ncbi:regulatory protein RecX [Endozoicomonas sp. SM1973]|uniref:Regulatory protein RecX n=1 Tax=Spartinivicinus marinus TaxID=2994442 RepID=A0A853I1N1_9GAMM|nr:regulatory protein RecX [Spartinivicinus marinus]MCX4025419.1 regulatory protein RecX [Spartinivicinus marinus]NYZ65352.1 regulatory protein RecX [Spartinivicinus marinus]